MQNRNSITCKFKLSAIIIASVDRSATFSKVKLLFLTLSREKTQTQVKKKKKTKNVGRRKENDNF